MTAYLTHENLPRADDPAASSLIASLDNPAAFDHAVSYIKLVETHISWILLTGDYAYKIKKPVDFGFLDFSTLEKRRHYCHEELRLNRRFAPRIYLDVVEIRGSETRPHIGGSGKVVEYAIKMIEFPQTCLLSSYAADHRLGADIVDAISDRLGEVHAAANRADADTDYGSAAQATHWSDENMAHIATAIAPEYLPNSYFELKRWYLENSELPALIETRKRDGFVRECHGDLHLGNMAMLDERVTFFDCIEFNPALRWIDTVSEAAFVAMDLNARGYPGYCWRFLNRYFQNGGDYAAVALLRYYFVYRALVRAKVEALRVDQETGSEDGYTQLIAPARGYIDLAGRWAGSHRAGLILMHGLSGSGKSTVAAQLVEILGAIRIRSDVERKRLYGYCASQRSGSALNQGIYTAQATEATYRRLGELATTIIDADFTVIVDATLLEESRRRQILGIESDRQFRRIIVDCQAPEAELRRRIIEREDDASEASLEVLERQMASLQPIREIENELAGVVTVGVDGLDETALLQIRKLLFS